MQLKTRIAPERGLFRVVVDIVERVSQHMFFGVMFIFVTSLVSTLAERPLKRKHNDKNNNDLRTW